MAQKFIWKHCKNTAHALSTVFPFDLFRTLSLLKPKRAKWQLSTLWPEEHDYKNIEIGEIGEDLAAQFLQEQGYKVLYRNFDPQQGGEIDLVCRDGSDLVFIEVKTRVQPKFRPLTAVNKSKRQYLKKGAAQYLRMLDQKPSFRFDVVEVVLLPEELPQCNLVKNIQM